MFLARISAKEYTAIPTPNLRHFIFNLIFCLFVLDHYCAIVSMTSFIFLYAFKTILKCFPYRKSVMESCLT